MTPRDKRFIVALATVCPTLIMALICLFWPAWSYGHTQPFLYLPYFDWLPKAGSQTVWRDYVEGMAYFALLISMLFVYRHVPWRTLFVFLIVGMVLGSLSWFAGVLALVMVDWLGAAAFYILRRFYRRSETWDRKFQQVLLTVMTGSLFSTGLKYGLWSTAIYVSLLIAMAFCLTAAIAEFGHGIVLWRRAKRARDAQQVKLVTE